MQTTNQFTRRQLTKLLGLAPFAANATIRALALPAKRDSKLDLYSSDPQIVNAFRWAKEQALAYVFDDDPVGPWYEAALPGRQAFCMRDTAHQAEGAQALGLARWNHNMLRRFAENISESRDWCSYWEIDRLNRPAPVDYKSDKQFWYNLPANYDILDACYRMFLWTGDRSYLNDPIFLNFYDRTIVDYTARWSLSPDRIMKRTSNIDEPPFFRGDPTYEESSRDNLVGVDLLATQYAAFRAYAMIQMIRGDRNKSANALQTAGQIKQLINTTWWNSAGGYYYAFFNKQHEFTGRAGADILYRDAAEPGTKTASAIDTLLNAMRSEPNDAVEAKSHYAETLYRYGRTREAYEQVLDLSRAGRVRREYPEVSYSVMGALVTGLMGVSIQPMDHVLDTASASFKPMIATRPALNSSSDWAEIRNLPVPGGMIAVRHHGNNNTEFTNQGNTPLDWKPIFHESARIVQIDGKPARHQAISDFAGEGVTVKPVEVAPGLTLRAVAR
ncbi:hypothetical protein [Silvibacterium acidisoli]|uniref:hypothetical protein n=1 Tax=Acidobacteriaceae bacterium ZG23-2 TaxID=2883246 RepID=UPI00406C874C